MNLKYGKIKLILILIFFKCTNQMDMENKKKLVTYGYLNSTEATNEEVTTALKKYQEFHNLTLTGEMDKKTEKLMSLPRCGMPDVPQEDYRREKWRKNYLKYKFYNTSGLLACESEKVFQEKIKLWTSNVNLILTESRSDNADISIHFIYQDGPLNKIGYGYYPENGSIYFDLFENWNFNRDSSQNGLYFGWAAAHELGHALGLEHNNESKMSIMYPYYVDEQKDPSEMDIKKLQELYGDGVLDISELCNEFSVDALLYTDTHGHILIKGTKYWTFVENKIQHGPFSLNSLFPELPNIIDAAFSTGKATYFFKNNLFYRFKGDSKNFRRKMIRTGFDNLTSNVDAAIYTKMDGMAYFFKGSQYYPFDLKKAPGNRMENDGKNISDWGGIDGNVEAATALDDNRVLLIKNGKCYIVDINDRKLLSAQSCTTMFNCPKNTEN